MNIEEVEAFIKSEMGVGEVTYDEMDGIHAFYFDFGGEECCISVESDGWVPEINNEAEATGYGVKKYQTYQEALKSIASAIIG